MASMRGGMVAENSTVCRVVPASPSRIASRSSAKPMSSISSASSSTTVSTPSSAQRAAADVVERAARAWPPPRRRRAPAPQLPADRLRRRRSAATRTPSVAAVAVDRLGHLHGQLAGGHQHQRRRRVPRRASGDSAAAAAAAARTRPSCRCRWRPGRAGPAGQQRRDRLALDRASALRSRARRRGQQLRRQRRGRRNRAGRARSLVRSQIGSLVAAGGSTSVFPRRARGPPARVLPGRCGLWWSQRTTRTT